jgi:potassium/hydrogen antiporter
MNLTIDNILLIGSLLLFISLLASRTAKYGIPTLLLFLLVGMLAGSDSFGGIYEYNNWNSAALKGNIILDKVVSWYMEISVQFYQQIRQDSNLIRSLH